MRAGERLVGWKAIGKYLGISADAARKMFARAGTRLPKLGKTGKTSPVYLWSGELLTDTLKSGIRLQKGD